MFIITLHTHMPMHLIFLQKELLIHINCSYYIKVLFKGGGCVLTYCTALVWGSCGQKQWLFSFCCWVGAGCTAMLGWLNDILWVMMLWSSLYTNRGYYDNDISLHYSFLARGNHQILDACAAAQMQEKKCLPKQNLCLTSESSCWIKREGWG